MSGSDPVDPVNVVELSGRLSAAPDRRELPGGDPAWSFRLVVRRDAGGVDTVDCAVYAKGLGRRIERWQAGDQVWLVGGLRRRFWRSPAGARSRYEVEVAQVRRLSKAG
jgi:single-strand DNA-binding protein